MPQKPDLPGFPPLQTLRFQTTLTVATAGLSSPLWVSAGFAVSCTQGLLGSVNAGWLPGLAGTQADFFISWLLGSNRGMYRSVACAPLCTHLPVSPEHTG